MKLSQLSKSTHHHILLFGPPKSGKTQLAGALASHYNLLWFDLENGITTLQKFPLEIQERIEVVQIPDTRSFPVAIETCLKAIKGGKGTICQAHGKWNCAVCTKESASVTEIHLPSLDNTWIVVFDSLTQLTNSGIAHITKNQPDDYKLDYDDWGNLGKLIDGFLSHVQQAPYHVICISHETEVPMQDKTNKLVPTAGTRNFSRNTAKYFGEVIYCELKNKRHVAGSGTGYANQILTGSRTGVALEAMKDNISLLPIFTGEVTIPNELTQNSPQQNANKNLEMLKAKLGK
jgi:DNA polymerase III delta prime subunit